MQCPFACTGLCSKICSESVICINTAENTTNAKTILLLISITFNDTIVDIILKRIRSETIYYSEIIEKSEDANQTIQTNLALNYTTST